MSEDRTAAPSVVHFMRKPLADYHSIENLFETLRRAMKGHADVSTAVCPEPSRGWFPRRRNLKWACARAGEVNHVTGDVHYLATALPPERTVLTVHDCVAMHRGGPLKRAVLKHWYFVKPVRHARMVTVISEATRRELIAVTGCAPGKIRLVPDCVSEVFDHAPREFNDSRPTVLMVGALPHKNLERTVRALEGESFRLRVIGRLTSQQQALLRAVDHTAEHDLSPEEMAQRYREADVVCFPSLYEGFGMPILEGQATGRAVITSGRAPMRDVAGGGACLVDPESEASIREGFRRVVSDAAYRAELIAKGLENVRQYSAERVAGMYLDIYREVRDS